MKYDVLTFVVVSLKDLHIDFSRLYNTRKINDYFVVAKTVF